VEYKIGTLSELGKAIDLARAAKLNKAMPLTIKSRWLERRRRKAAQTRLGEITERAARLGITTDRVLEEYALIAFANLGHIVEWDDKGVMSIKQPDELGAVAEIVQSAGSGKPYRVKLYDKRAALDAIARYLGMTPLAGAAPDEDEPTPEEADNARHRLIDALDRLAAEAGERPSDQRADG
jgi:hypothetical protein